MKKVIIFVSIVLIIIVGVTVYIKNNNILTSNENIKKDIETELTISNFKEKLEENGLKVTLETKKAGELIGADEGYSYTINNETIEIYKFNLNSDDELTKSNLKAVKDEEKMYMPSFNNYSFEAKINKNLVIMVFSEHPNKTEILDIFNKM